MSACMDWTGHGRWPGDPTRAPAALVGAGGETEDLETHRRLHLFERTRFN